MPHPSRIYPILLLAFFLISFSATAQESDQPKSIIQDDLEFARGLARFRYFDLADEFVAEIKKGRLTDEEEITLQLTNAQILKWAAEYSTSRKERREFYKQAIERFKDYTQYNTDHAEYNKTRIDLAVVLQNQGRFLGEGMELTKDPEIKQALKEEASSAYRESVMLFNDVARNLEKRAEAYETDGEQDLADKCLRQSAEADYKRGVAYYHFALIFDKRDDSVNREDYLNSAIETLDEYIWEAPDNDFWVLWAYLYQSKSYSELGKLTEALDLAMQVYDPHTGIDLKQAVDLQAEYARLITDLTESAFFQVAHIYNLKGDYEKAVSTVNQLKTLFEENKLEMSPLGDKALLEQAEGYKNLDKINLALEVAKGVSDRNPGNEVGNDAKRFIEDLIDREPEGPGAESTTMISPDILFTAAEGAHLQKKYTQAIQGYYRVFKAIKTVDQEKAFTAKTWYCIGQCFKDMLRPLEASIAFKTGFFSKYAKADETTREYNGNNWYMAAGKRFKETNHSYDEAAMKLARDTLVQAGISTDFLFFIAKEKFDKAQITKSEEHDDLMKDAIESFQDVKKTSTYYEKSLIYLARCYQDLKQYDMALKRLDDFESFVRKSPPPATARQKGARIGASAEAVFYRAEIYLTQEKYQKALDLLSGFEETFDSQTNFFPAIVYFRILSQIGLEKFAEAEKLFKEMKENYSSSGRYSVAAYRIGKAYAQAAEKLRGTAERSEQKPPDKYFDYLRKAAEYMYQYCEMSGFDSFTNLKNVCDWYKELGDFEKARTTYERLIQEFGKDPERKTEIEKSVSRSYAEVLLALKDFQAAKPIWLRLLNADKKNPTLLRSTALCLGGWLEWDGMEYIEVPGSGDYLPSADADPNKIRLDNALSIWRFMLRALKVNKPYGPEWWEAKFQTVYIRYMSARLNPQQYNEALTVIKNVEVFHEDLGGPEIKRKFKYIRSAIRNRK